MRAVVRRAVRVLVLVLVAVRVLVLAAVVVVLVVVAGRLMSQNWKETHINYFSNTGNAFFCMLMNGIVHGTSDT